MEDMGTWHPQKWLSSIWHFYMSPYPSQQRKESRDIFHILLIPMPISLHDHMSPFPRAVLIPFIIAFSKEFVTKMGNNELKTIKRTSKIAHLLSTVLTSTFQTSLANVRMPECVKTIINRQCVGLEVMEKSWKQSRWEKVENRCGRTAEC